MAKVEVRDTPDRGKGLFALERIPKGTLIGEYTGTYIDREETLRRERTSDKVWIFTIEGDLFLDPDGHDCLVKYANHSCEPNAEVEVKDRRVFFLALVDIAPQEEITIDYALEVPDDDERSYDCLCGAATCRGTMKDVKKPEKREKE